MFIDIQDSLKETHGFLFDREPGFWYFNSFEHEGNNDHYFRGKSSYSGKKSKKQTIVDFQQGVFETNTPYMLSCWLFNDTLDALNHYFRIIIEEYDPLKKIWYSTEFIAEYCEVIYNDWSLLEMEFEIRSPDNYISVKTEGKPFDDQNFYLDDMLIVKKGVNVYKVQQIKGNQIVELFMNNHHIGLPTF
jgi:hypothetical protein